MLRVGRPRAAWLIALGLLGAGWVTAHVLSYLIVVPNTSERRHMLMETGHGYVRTADLLTLFLTLTLVGLAACLVSEARRGVRAPSPWMLAVLPPIGFVVQEHVERIAVTGAFPAHLLAEPRFWLGLLLQLPFAFAALVCARVLLRAARRLALSLAGPQPNTAAVEWLSTVLPPHPDLPRRPVLASGYSERGPPLSSSG